MARMKLNVGEGTKKKEKSTASIRIEQGLISHLVRLQLAIYLVASVMGEGIVVAQWAGECSGAAWCRWRVLEFFCAAER